MATMEFALELLRRQEAEPEAELIECDASNEYDGRLGLRVSAIFVILVGSMSAAVFPVFAKQRKSLDVPEWAFFFAKYFGSGVIIATAFIHLLVPGRDALTNECLTGAITEYAWPEGIALMSAMVMFFTHTWALRYGTAALRTAPISQRQPDETTRAADENAIEAHSKGHDVDHERAGHGIMSENYAAQLTSVFILEFGILFHSIFIGLTLAVAGEEFVTLYIVLTFHQTFEGLGLGASLAKVDWPQSKEWTPYILGAVYGLSTPLAIAIGIAVRQSYSPGVQTTLVVNGVFDSISAGILLYTGFVELMAHDVVFNSQLRDGPQRKLWSAFILVCLGVALMALLGKWA